MTFSGLFLLTLFWTQVTLGMEITWNKTGPGKRYSATDSIIANRKLPRIFCAAACGQHIQCVSFNYHSEDKCQLVNTAPYLEDDSELTQESGWDHYSILVPEKRLDSSLCPAGSVLLPYDQPAYLKFDPNLDGYTCSNNDWILNQVNQGKTDCRLVLLYNKEFFGLDAVGFQGGVGPYHAVLKQCLQYSCVSMICHNPDTCWLKVGSHLTASSTLTDKPFLYWYTLCQ